MNNIEDIAKKIVDDAKGILAADESTNTIKKRFDSINIKSTKQTRCDYREILFSSNGMSKFISGVILFEETFFQKNKQGQSLKKILENSNFFPVIKIDQGLEKLNNSPFETYTKGIETLNERLKPFVENGAKFTKWRAVINIGKNIPTIKCIKKNSELLAEYAAISQKNHLVSIVEPEIIMEGKHGLEECYEVTKNTLIEVFNCLKKKNVNLRGMLLKPNTIVPGNISNEKLDIKKSAEKTLKCLKETVPNDVPGIIFLSGGLSSLDATMILNEINDLKEKKPWKISFSYGRALQENALKTWLGKNENKENAQKIFLHRAKMNSLASAGKWNESFEKYT